MPPATRAKVRRMYHKSWVEDRAEWCAHADDKGIVLWDARLWDVRFSDGYVREYKRKALQESLVHTVCGKIAYVTPRSSAAPRALRTVFKKHSERPVTTIIGIDTVPLVDTARPHVSRIAREDREGSTARESSDNEVEDVTATVLKRRRVAREHAARNAVEIDSDSDSSTSHSDSSIKVSVDTTAKSRRSTQHSESSAAPASKPSKVKLDLSVKQEKVSNHFAARYGDVRNKLIALVDTVRKNLLASMVMTTPKRRKRKRALHTLERKRALHTLENCVHTARSVAALLRHPVYPFDLKKAESVRINTDKADFPLEMYVYNCDGCDKVLWQEDIYRLPNAKPEDALCSKCAANSSATKCGGSNFPVLLIAASQPEAVSAAEASRQSGSSLFTFEADAAVEVLDGHEATLVREVGPCRMHRSQVDQIVTLLSGLRRQRSADGKGNGMMSGLICLRYANPVAAGGNKFHAINFLVGPQREVFFIDVCAKNKTDRFPHLVLILLSICRHHSHDFAAGSCKI